MTTKKDEENVPLERKDLVAKSNEFADLVSRTFFRSRSKDCKCKHCSAAWVLAFAFLAERIMCELDASELMFEDDWFLLDELTDEGRDNIQGFFEQREKKAAVLVSTILQDVKKETPS